MTWKEAVLTAMRAVSPHNSYVRNQEIQHYIEKQGIIELNNTVKATISKNLEFLEHDGKVERIDRGIWRMK